MQDLHVLTLGGAQMTESMPEMHTSAAPMQSVHPADASDVEPPWVSWRLWTMHSRGGVRGVSLPVGRLELAGRDVPAGRVQAFGVPPAHPAGGGELDLLGGSPASTVDE